MEVQVKNNFEEYGFTADFEGEIFMTQDSEDWGKIIFGRVNSTLVGWEENGQCRDIIGDKIDNWLAWDKYNLAPIKKEWYEEESNFPKYAIQLDERGDSDTYDEYPLLFRTIEDFNKFGGDYRPATEEEVLSLLIKE